VTHPRIPLSLPDDETPGWSSVACPSCDALVRHYCWTDHGTCKVPHRERVAAADRHLFALTPLRWIYVGPGLWYFPAQAAEEAALDLDLPRGSHLEIVEPRDRAGRDETGQRWPFTVTTTGVTLQKKGPA